MITIQPHESLKYLSRYIGQTLQKYTMFQSLLSLKAVDFTVIKNSEKSSKLEKNDIEHGPNQNEGLVSGPGQDNIPKDEYDRPIYTKFRDGDEFVFSCTSFDKWIKIIIVYQLLDDPSNYFSSKVEMRVVGYYPNSHFFNLIQKFAINVWNEQMGKSSKKKYYILKDISFMNRKIIKENMDNENKNQDKILSSINKPSDRLEKVRFRH